MKKFIKALVLVAVVIFASSQVFAAISIKILNCGAPRTASGQMMVGVGYKVQIRGGFDTHTTNLDGTIGVVIPTTFQLVSTVVYPNAQPKYTQLTVVSQNADGSLNLAAEGVKVVLSKNMDRAQVVFGNNSATATCD